MGATNIFRKLLSVLSTFATLTSAAKVGDCVVFEGYIMDEFCINRGTLFDNQDQASLMAPGPEVHSIHCLVDVDACIQSGYTVLADNGDDSYSVAYRFDDMGDSLVKALAEESGAEGACNLCDGASGKNQTAGFRATIVGNIVALGDSTSDDPVLSAPTVAVSQVLESGVSTTGLTCPEFVPEPEIGDCVCTEGYIMDEFCINRGTLFDNQDQESLVAPGPEVHSLHCLVDVQPCIDSGYTVLADNGDDTYSVGYRLDDKGDSMVFDFAVMSGAEGACNDCVASNGGDVVNGFRATVIGTLTGLGDSSATSELDRAHTLAVSEVHPSATGCANFDPTSCPALEEEPPMEPPVGPMSLVLSEEPMVHVEYEVVSTDSGDALDVTFTYESEGWVAMGLSPDGKMAGSEVVIAIPPAVPEKYVLSLYDISGVTRMPDEQQTLMGASVMQEDGVTTMKYQKLLAEDGELEIIVGAENSFVYAVGNANELAYHRMRSPFTTSIFEGAPPLAVGDCVVFEGYIMDEFCINRGTLFDNPGQPTLMTPGPEVHSIHCLVDVPQCINSGYTVLADNGDDSYSVAYRFDNIGDSLVKALAEESGAEGACDLCDGDSGGTQTAGFRATIVGRVMDLGDASSADPVLSAPTLSVAQVLPSDAITSSLTCPEPVEEPEVGDCICSEGFIMDEFCINRGTLFDNQSQETLIAPGPEVHSLHCLVDVPQCINSGYTVLADNGDETYSVAYRFDDAGDAMMLDLAISSGTADACDECLASNNGDVVRGFRAAVIGTISELGDATSSDPVSRGHSLVVHEVLPISTGCANFVSSSACPALEEDDDETDGGGLTSLLVSEDPVVRIEYEVLTPETSQDLTPEAIAAGGVLNVTFTYEGVGWLALGVSPDGTMVGSEVVIAAPPSIPEKYTISEYALTGLNRRPDAEQTLINPMIVQTDTTTTMTFQKLLVEPGEFDLVVGEQNTFIWAVGNANELAYHRTRGPFTASLAAGEPIELGSTVPPYQSFWKAHGIMAALAWGAFAPIAIGASMCRGLIPGEGVWLRIHFAFNSLCVLFTVIFFSIAYSATAQAGVTHFLDTHQKVGVSVFVISLFQVLMGIFRPHLPHAEEDKEEDGSPKEEGAPEQVLASSKSNDPPHMLEKSAGRQLFEILHRLTGGTLMGLALYNINEGLALYSERYATDDYSYIFWIWVFWVILFIALGTIYTRTKTG